MSIRPFLLPAEPPSFTEAPKSVTKAAEVQDVTLRCRTFGAPTPVITWTKDDGQPITDNRFKVRRNGDLKIKVGSEACHVRLICCKEYIRESCFKRLL